MPFFAILIGIWCKTNEKNIKKYVGEILKKTVIALVALTMLSVSAPSFALETKENAVVCISQKKLMRYESLVKKDEQTFLKMMRDKAECMPMVAPLTILVESEVGKYLKVTTSEGMPLWVNQKDVQKTSK